MAKAIKKVAVVLGAVALIATGVGALGGLGIIAAATANTIGIIAGVAAGVANIGATLLAKPPPARGSVTQIIIDPESPTPYVMGGILTAGVMRHRAGYGATIDEVPNPYFGEVVVYSGCGPVKSISPRVDLAAITSWYTGFLYTTTQLGSCPESTYLAPYFAGMPGWTSASKLSGYAAILWNFKFDKAGKVFANGRPETSAYVEGVKVYDPRLDSTFPGGSGSCRLGTESTYVYSENPALHAGTYAYGRYQNGKRVFGIGIPADGIDWAKVAAWANLCDTNEWKIAGVIYEPGDRGANLIDICAAGGGEPIFGSTLSFRYSAPVVALDTVTEDDIANADMSVVAMQDYNDRYNTVVPKYRSPDHDWEIVSAAPIVNTTTLAEDGEERRAVWPFNFVKDKDQAAQLAAYRLMDSREFYPIEITVSPRLRGYKPGDCLHLYLPQLSLDTDAVILTRRVDPETMTVALTLIGETPGKHAFALGKTGTAPPTPALKQTSQERDELTNAVLFGGNVVHDPASATTTFAASASGTLVSGQLPRTIAFRRLRVGVDVSSAATWTVQSQGGITGATVTISNGTVTIPSGAVIPLATSISIRSVADGVTVNTVISVIRQDGQSTAGAGTENVSQAVSGMADDVTYVAITPEFNAKTGATGVLTFSGSLTFAAINSIPLGTFGARAKWQINTGSWVDVSTYKSSTVSSVVQYVDGYGSIGSTNGSINVADSKTGLTPSTSYPVRLMAARPDIVVDKELYFGGTAFVAGS